MTTFGLNDVILVTKQKRFKSLKLLENLGSSPERLLNSLSASPRLARSSVHYGTRTVVNAGFNFLIFLRPYISKLLYKKRSGRFLSSRILPTSSVA